MSLVERAIKKLQESQGARPAADTPAPKTPRPPQPNEAAVERAAPPIDTTRVVSIDRARLRDMNLLPPQKVERQIASQYQQIKRTLVASVLSGTLGRASHVVMLASAIPGEGKTFTSINLALSLAREKDIEVLMVDGDVAKPHVSRIFGIEQERGLMDLLVHPDLHPNQVILRTDVPGLSLMSAGHSSETATELLASARMSEIIQQLAAPDGRRVVLLDSPPLLLSTEARALVPCAGQVVLVVGAESTSRTAVKDALAAIGEGRPVSLILNQSSLAPTEGYYGYYGDSSAPQRTA